MFIIKKDKSYSMILAWIIYVLIMVYAVYDYKKTCLSWIPISVLFNNQIALFYSPGLSLVVAVNVSLVILYFFLGNKLTKREVTEKFLFTPVVWISLASFLISYIFSRYPQGTGFNITIKYFVCSFGLIFLLQKALQTINDIKVFVRAALLVVILITTLGLYESVFQDNPVLDYVYNNTPHTGVSTGRMYYVPGHLQYRYGMVRASSFFGIHIIFGCTCLYFLYLFGTLYQRKKFFANKGWIVLSCILLFLGVIASNSKTPLLGLIILVFIFIKINKSFNVKFFFITVLIFVLLFPILLEYINNLVSLFDTDLAEQGSGSTMAVRERQLGITIQLFNLNPIIGSGVGSLGYIREKTAFSDISGAESIWFKILPERGIIGVLSYLSIYWVLYTSSKDIIPTKSIVLFILTILVVQTATGDFEMQVWLSVFLVVRRIYQLTAKNRVLTISDIRQHRYKNG